MSSRGLYRFLWVKAASLGDGQHYCEWNGLTLWADQYGTWNVCLPPVKENKPWRVVISDKMQAAGTNLQDAQRRAQAAAMGLHIT